MAQKEMIKSARNVENLLPTMKENPYIEFSKKYDNPIDNAQLKKYEYVKGDAPQEHFFHSTKPDNLAGIAKNGLLRDGEKNWCDSYDAVFVSEYPAYATLWLVRLLTLSNSDMIHERNNNCHIGLLRIKESAIDDWKWDSRGSDSTYGYSYYSKTNIPPQHIDLRTKRGWKKITNLF